MQKVLNVTLTPLYTPNNCAQAYQLNWSLAIFWRQPPPHSAEWLGPLKEITEADGVRILECRTTSNKVSQFLLSTTPEIAPCETIRVLKGRLQYLLNNQIPKCFRRNYSLTSVGSANVTSVERYVATQAKHHRMADPRAHELLEKYQFHNPRIDLTQRMRSASGEFIYNLHLVLVNKARLADMREKTLSDLHATLQRIATKKQHRLARAGLTADHLHLALGCNITESPQSVALGYLNNLAFVCGMCAVFQFGFFVGTFGQYDLQAIRRSLSTVS